MTRAEHIERHQYLHNALDELAGDFLRHHPGKHLSNTTLLELMDWSHKQTIEPDETPT